MKTKIFCLALLLATSFLFYSSCKKDSDDDSSNNTNNNNTDDPAARTKALNDYNNIYLPSQVSNPGWTGSTTGCNAGTVSSGVDDKVLQRLNYFRALVGLSAIIKKTDKSQACQEMALMIKINYLLTQQGDNPHDPPATWTCYTQAGHDVAGSSNICVCSEGTSISEANHSTKAVTGFIEDPGSGFNDYVPHRRWFLYSRLNSICHGSTDQSCCIYYDKSEDFEAIPSGTPEYIAYPPAGYIPNTLVFPKWSFSIPHQYVVNDAGVDYTNTTITMTDQNNNSITIANNKIFKWSQSMGYVGDPAITWTPTGINTSSSSDITYHVTINNVVVSGVTKNYSYDVIVMAIGSKKSAGKKAVTTASYF